MFNLAENIKTRLSRLMPHDKGNDPLTNLKTATLWVESLPAGDALKSQNAILIEIKHFNENLTQPTKERLSVLMLLDEKSRDLQDTLVQQYLRNARMSRVMESQLWHGINNLYWEIARGYHAYVLDFSRNTQIGQNAALLPLITLRAIRAFGLLLRWRAIRYQQPPENIWLRLHKLYRVAESGQFHQRKFRMYPQDQTDSTCESAYFRVLMLNLANSGTLYPRQLHMVDRWLESWVGKLGLEDQLDLNKHGFSVDLSADYGPRRTRNSADDKPMRHWSVAALSKQLDVIRLSLREGSPPALLGLTEDARVTESIDLLGHLQHQWSAMATREQRQSPRERVKSMVEIANGFDNIISQIKIAGAQTVGLYGDNLPYMEADDVTVYGFVTERTRNLSTEMRKLRPEAVIASESWVMQDESATGYGAVVETHNLNWLRVGALVATKPHETKTWRLGVVRRLFRLDEESSSVGIETFAESPDIVMLSANADASGYTVNGFDSGGTPLPIACIWLASGNDNRNASLVIDPVHLQAKKVFEIHGKPGIKFIRIGNPIERSEGWVRVAIEPIDS